jgi:hypothetical protein
MDSYELALAFITLGAAIVNGALGTGFLRSPFRWRCCS